MSCPHSPNAGASSQASGGLGQDEPDIGVLGASVCCPAAARTVGPHLVLAVGDVVIELWVRRPGVGPLAARGNFGSVCPALRRLARQLHPRWVMRACRDAQHGKRAAQAWLAAPRHGGIGR
jgi:hypothetical protein